MAHFAMRRHDIEENRTDIYVLFLSQIRCGLGKATVGAGFCLQTDQRAHQDVTVDVKNPEEEITFFFVVPGPGEASASIYDFFNGQF